MTVGFCGYSKREQTGGEKFAGRIRPEVHIPSSGKAAEAIRYNGRGMVFHAN